MLRIYNINYIIYILIYLDYISLLDENLKNNKKIQTYNQACITLLLK